MHDPHDENSPYNPDNEHPRIAKLRWQVRNLPIDESWRAELLVSIHRFREQFITRPVYAPEDGWDDLEALQQATLAEMMARLMKEKRSKRAPKVPPGGSSGEPPPCA